MLPGQPVVVNAFVDNLGNDSVASARIEWPDNVDDSPTITPSKGGVVLNSSRIISDPNEYEIPVTVMTSAGDELDGLAHVVVTNPDGSQPSPIGLSKPWNQAMVGEMYEPNGPGAMSRALMARGNGAFTFTPMPPSPSNLTIDGSGNINWKPTAAQVGNQRISVMITDIEGKTRLQTFPVTVSMFKAAGGCGCDLSGTAPPFSLLAMIVVALAVFRARQ